MMYSKLSDYDFKKGILRSKFSQMVTPLDKSTNWSHAKSPEYLWIGLILKNGNRNEQMIKMMSFLSNLSKVLPEEKFKLPTMSNILSLDNNEKEVFITEFKKFFNLKFISSLTLILPSGEFLFKQTLSYYNLSIEKRLKNIKEVLDDLSNQYSQLATDVRYFVLYFKLLRKKIVFTNAQAHLAYLFENYPFLTDNDLEICYIKSMIRNFEITISQQEDLEYNFAPIFWENISQLSDCEVFSITVNNDEEKVDLVKVKEEVYRLLEYYKDLLQNVEQFNIKLMVLTSILTYSYKRLLELINHDLRFSISGRSIVRSCIENYMMSKYLIANEKNHENIWEKFQYYGIGNYKLISERFIENKPSITHSHVNFEYLDVLVSEYTNKEFIDIDTRYFGSNIRQKFKEIEEEDLYKYYYDYDSQYEHGLWGAIRESSILKCVTSGHQYHGIPDIDDIQKLPDVGSDIKMIFEKHLSVIKSEFSFAFKDNLEG